VLFWVKRGRFTRRTNGDNAMGSIVQMEVHKLVEMLPVDASIVMHRCDQSDKATRNHKSSV
jgi:hypothetical protein